MIRHEHVTGNVLGYLGMKRCHPSQSLVVAQKVPPMRHLEKQQVWKCVRGTHARVWLSNGATLRNGFPMVPPFAIT